MKKKDILIIVGILLSAFVSFLIIELTKDEGAYVVVRVDGVEVGKGDIVIDFGDFFK